MRRGGAVQPKDQPAPVQITVRLFAEDGLQKFLQLIP